MKKIVLLVLSVFIVVSLFSQRTQRSLQWGDSLRKYIEFLPANFNASTQHPVLFCLHGLGDNMTNFAGAGFESIADTAGWIVITPQALVAKIAIMGTSYSVGAAWGAGVGAENVNLNYNGMPIPIGTVNLNSNVDDVGFLTAILDSLVRNYNIDQTKVFFTGFSMGGFMCHKMAINKGNRIKAIAAVSGTIGKFCEFTPTHKLNVLHIHGTADNTITYENATFSQQGMNVGSVGTGAEETIEKWRAYNNCINTPVIFDYPNSNSDGLTFKRYIYKNADENEDYKVAFIKVENGDHNWYSKPANDIDYATEIFKFFTNTMENIPSKKCDIQNYKDVAIYPNPANDKLIINIDNVDNHNVKIYNLLGVKVLDMNVNKIESSVDLTNLNQGIYLIKISDGKISHEHKLVIKR